MSAHTGATSSTSDTVDVGEMLRVVLRGWFVVVAFVAFGGLAAVAVVRWTPRKFPGKASLVIKGQGAGSVLNSLGSLPGAGAGLLSSVAASPLETDVAVLDSKNILGQVVDSLMLQVRVLSPRGMNSIQVLRSLRLPSLFASRTIRVRRLNSSSEFAVTWNTLPVNPVRELLGLPYDPKFDTTVATRDGIATLPTGTLTFADRATLPPAFTLSVSDREDAVTRTAKRVEVSKPGGEIVSIDYVGDDSLTAAAVPNAMIAKYLQWRRTNDRGTNTERVDFLSAALATQLAKLRTEDEQLRRAAESTGLLDPEAAGHVDYEAEATVAKAASDLEVEDGALQKLIADFRAGTVTQTQLAAFPSFFKSPAINGYLADISTAEEKRAELLATATTNDPLVQAYGQSIDSLKGKLLPIATTYESSVARQLTDVRHELDSLRTVISALPAGSEITSRAQRDVLNDGKIYSAMLAQLTDARLAAIGEGGDIHVLDTATPAKKPSSPQPTLTLAIGLAGGLIVGVLAVLFASATSRWIRDPRELASAAEAPVIRLDPAIPLLLGTTGSPTLLVAPLDGHGNLEPVIQRLVRTATAQARTVTVLDLEDSTSLTRADGILDVERVIEELEAGHSMVIVKLPGIASDAAAAAMRHGRPILLVAANGRVNRSRLSGTMDVLSRLGIPCAGIVINAAGRGDRTDLVSGSS